MKNLLFLLLIAFPIQAQDTVRIRHSNYTTVFSKSLRYPVLVEWWDSKSSIGCSVKSVRQNKFIPDSVLKEYSDIGVDYAGSGFDRGHLSPAADNACQGPEVMAESFLFTNMVPQYPGLNRGAWKMLEEHTRELALFNDSVWVQTGCVGVAKRIHRVAVPTHCWKMITVKKTGHISAFSFPNIAEKSSDFIMHAVTVDSVNKLRGIGKRSAAKKIKK